jgi:hypothetical protein
MEAGRRIGTLRLRATRTRCEALNAALNSFRNRTQASPAVRCVLNALQKAVEHLKAYLEDLEKSPMLDVLSEGEIEAKIHFASTHLPMLHLLFGLIEHSDITSVPAEITSPIRREILKLFPDSELIVVASTHLNYSIVEITPVLKELFEKLKQELPPGFPERIYRTSIPAVEYDQALLHCILAHEMGHPLYEMLKIADTLGPIKVDEGFLKAFMNQVKQDPNFQAAGLDELKFVQYLTSTMNRIIPAWIEELAADQFGLLLFGPAYLLAYINLGSSVGLLDSASDSHPPDRFRLKTIFDLLDKRYDAKVFSQSTKDFLGVWRPVVGQKPELQSHYMLTYSWLVSNGIPEKIQEAVLKALDSKSVYTQEQYQGDLTCLVPIINAQVPVAEVLKNGKSVRTELTSILNAGWDSFLSGLKEFRQFYPDEQAMSEFELNVKFNRFLLKSMELNEVIRVWEEGKK